MGYYISLDDVNFKMKKENIEKALQEVKRNVNDLIELQLNNKSCCDLGVNEFDNISADFDVLLNAKTIREIFNEFNYDIEFDSISGDIISLSFIGEKIYDEESLFSVIAPYVEANSYIQMKGEDGEVWRWAFKNKRLYVLESKLIFDEIEDI